VKAKAPALAAKPTDADLAEAMLILVDKGILRQVSNAGSKVDPAAAKSAAASCGYLLAATAAAARADAISPEARQHLIKASGTCQNILSLVGGKLSAGSVPSVPDTAEELKKATREGDASFVLEAEKIFGPRGLLLKPPFNFPTGSFPTN